jgi:hypothetical protein
VDEQQLETLERERPVDLARFTWAAWIDWALGIGIGIALLALTSAILGDVSFFALSLIAGLYGIGWWRAQRMSKGLTVMEQDAQHGRFSAVVRLRNGNYFQFVGSARQTAALTVDNGWVGLGSERWPSGSVSVGPQPSWLMYRGIELHTPSGSRFVTSVRSGDPSLYLSVVLDRRVRDAFGRALAGQYGGMAANLNPAGWYPDPAGSPAWRWWDGQQWGPLSN